MAGKVTSLVGKKEQALAMQIERGIASGSSLEAMKKNTAPATAAQQRNKGQGKREPSSRTSAGPARRGGANTNVKSRSNGLGGARGSAGSSRGKMGKQR